MDFECVVTAMSISDEYKHVRNWLVGASGYQQTLSLDAFRCNGERADKKNKILYFTKPCHEWHEDYLFLTTCEGKEYLRGTYLEFPTESFGNPFDFYDYIGYDRKKRKFTGERKWQ